MVFRRRISSDPALYPASATTVSKWISCAGFEVSWHDIRRSTSSEIEIQLPQKNYPAFLAPTSCVCWLKPIVSRSPPSIERDSESQFRAGSVSDRGSANVRQSDSEPASVSEWTLSEQIREENRHRFALLLDHVQNRFPSMMEL